MRRWSLAALATAAVIVAAQPSQPDVAERGGWDRNGPAITGSAGPDLDQVATPKEQQIVARKGGGWDLNGPLTSGTTGPDLDNLSAPSK